MVPSQAVLVEHLRAGAGRWIEAKEAEYWARAIEHEWDRVLLWRARINPQTGAPYSYYAAARIVAHNTPAFDRAWAEAWTD